MSRFRVDLRSDTVTTPSPEMRAAMAEAEVGDAWYGDDPTVNRLQELAAERLGMPAALYAPTGTMANQIGLALHVRTQRASRRVLERGTHRDDGAHDVGSLLGPRLPNPTRAHEAGSMPVRPGSCSSPTPITTSRSSTCSVSRTPPVAPGGG